MVRRSANLAIGPLSRNIDRHWCAESPCLLHAQRGHRVHPHGAAGRQVAGHQLHRQKDRGHCCESCRIGRSHAVKHAGQYVRQRQRRTAAQCDAGRGVPQPLPQNRTRHIRAARSERRMRTRSPLQMDFGTIPRPRNHLDDETAAALCVLGPGLIAARQQAEPSASIYTFQFGRNVGRGAGEPTPALNSPKCEYTAFLSADL